MVTHPRGTRSGESKWKDGIISGLGASGAGLWGCGQFLGGRDLHGSGGWVTELAILRWLGGGGEGRLQGVGLAHLAADRTQAQLH